MLFSFSTLFPYFTIVMLLFVKKKETDKLIFVIGNRFDGEIRPREILIRRWWGYRPSVTALTQSEVSAHRRSFDVAEHDCHTGA